MEHFTYEIEDQKRLCEWDWYQATVHNNKESFHKYINEKACKYYDLVDVVPARGINSYQYGCDVVRGDHVLFSYYWGGNGDTTNFKATGENAPAFREFMSEFKHSVTRMDSKFDWVEPGLFERLSNALVMLCKDKKISMDYRGNWGDPDDKNGRTLYAGSKQSDIRICLYEKGRQQGYKTGYFSDWVRLEVRFKPSDKLTKQVASSFDPYQIFNIGWVQDYIRLIGADIMDRAQTKTWKTSDDERARRALIKQYGAIIEKWAEEQPNGWSDIGSIMRSKISEYRSSARAR